ncbi:serpin family protein [Cecembia lonarensis]|uniref:Serine protease inhibitor n=1 Tax=Cecembia lonarensis (strain CCUG 58316 / KCTC 22772 / LW9) TaxID=1225176 RepID=K1L767_CECL9|nr:serpin family protein [Cecembia lonarensis]EKB47942.1 Serine protease inhibitor [Cecembia lonarensis LW9]
MKTLAIIIKVSGEKVLGFLFFLVTAVSCLPSENPLTGPVEPNLRALSATEEILSQSSTQFAIDIFKQIGNKESDKNLFFSPFSIHQALSMTMNGNEGDILEEFKNVLRYQGLSLDEANQDSKELTDFLLQLDPKVKLAIANAIWYKQGYQVYAPFKEIAQRYYRAEVSALDMGNPNSVNVINNWIAQQTNNLIRDMLDNIPANAVMYLVNAIYFKAEWTYNFPKANTKKENFFPNSGQEVMVDMMDLGKAAGFRYYGSIDYGYIEIPYSSGQYNMGVLIGQDGNTAALASYLTLENLEKWKQDAKDINLILKMPKFKIQYKIPNMAEDLMALGLEKPFDFHPDNFTKLFSNPTDALKISRVIHEALIEVDEQGTEAAAATIVEIVERVNMGPSEPAVLTLDRPFIFFIQEKHSGAILFMGKLENPLEN